MRLSSSTPLLPFHELLLNFATRIRRYGIPHNHGFTKSAFPFENAFA
jgi:hypothetical protein